MRVYIVIEEYDPRNIEDPCYIDKLFYIRGAFSTKEKALDFRNEMVRNEVELFGYGDDQIEITEEEYANPDRALYHLGSFYFIKELDVE